MRNILLGIVMFFFMITWTFGGIWATSLLFPRPQDMLPGIMAGFGLFVIAMSVVITLITR